MFLSRQWVLRHALVLKRHFPIANRKDSCRCIDNIGLQRAQIVGRGPAGKGDLQAAQFGRDGGGLVLVDVVAQGAQVAAVGHVLRQRGARAERQQHQQGRGAQQAGQTGQTTGP